MQRQIANMPKTYQYAFLCYLSYILFVRLPLYATRILQSIPTKWGYFHPCDNFVLSSRSFVAKQIAASSGSMPSARIVWVLLSSLHLFIYPFRIQKYGPARISEWSFLSMLLLYSLWHCFVLKVSKTATLSFSFCKGPHLAKEYACLSAVEFFRLKLSRCVFINANGL